MANIFKNKGITVKELKAGDVLEFKDAGEWATVDFSKARDGSDLKEVFQIGTSINGTEGRKFTTNGTTRKILAQAWGPETDQWVGKKAKVGFVQQLSFGELKNVLLLTPLE